MNTLFFDLETSGPSPTHDRVIELAILVIDENDNILLNKAKRYNPGIKISKQATEVHGITDEDVKDCPSFAEDAKKLKKIFENKIIITYNGLKFDIPLILSEFERAEVDVKLSGKFIDVLLIERKLNPHTLSNAYKKYTGKELDSAHRAMSDVLATGEVLKHQIKNFGLDEDKLYELSGTKEMVDYSGKLKKDAEGYLVFTFGKCINKRVIDEKEYVSWLLNSDFPTQVKKLIQEEVSKHTMNFKKVTPTKVTSYYAKPGSKQETLYEGEPYGDLPF